MPELSPVETLRAAAERLRTLARDATPGPWGEWTVDPRPRRQVITDAGWPIAEVFERGESGADAAWIALMHPGVAEPLAPLFEKLAWLLQLDADLIGRVGNEEVVAVARVLLGVPDAPDVKAKSAPKRGTCPVCDGTFNLTKAGVLRHHSGDVYVGGWRQVCDGVGEPPRESTDAR